MREFDFDKLEKNRFKLAKTLKLQMQTRLFDPVSPDFDVVVDVFDQGRGYGKKISVETSDIAERMNFKMFAEVKLHNFGGGLINDSNQYWLPIDWRWSHKDGGSNGTRAFTCYVTDDGELSAVTD